MCGRYVSPTEADMERYWAIPESQRRNPLAQRFNVAPTVQVPILFDQGGLFVLDSARWGLIPMWWSKPKPPPFTFNTRIEEAGKKPMWREPLKESRCIVPALGWYEWKEAEQVDPATGEIKKAKQPYFIHLPGRKVLGFAGLMSRRWANPEKSAIDFSCSIITKEAKGPSSEIHARMPVILPKATHSAWIDPKRQDACEALDMARKVAVQNVKLYPVSTRVNYSKNEGAELLEPFPNPA